MDARWISKVPVEIRQHCLARCIAKRRCCIVIEVDHRFLILLRLLVLLILDGVGVADACISIRESSVVVVTGFFLFCTISLSLFSPNRGASSAERSLSEKRWHRWWNWRQSQCRHP